MKRLMIAVAVLASFSASAIDFKAEVKKDEMRGLQLERVCTKSETNADGSYLVLCLYTKNHGAKVEPIYIKHVDGAPGSMDEKDGFDMFEPRNNMDKITLSLGSDKFEGIKGITREFNKKKQVISFTYQYIEKGETKTTPINEVYFKSDFDSEEYSTTDKETIDLLRVNVLNAPAMIFEIPTTNLQGHDKTQYKFIAKGGKNE